MTSSHVPAWEQERRAIVVNAIGVGLATAAYGISFGAFAVSGGLSVLQAQILSVVMFTGGSQFALVGVIAAGGAMSSAVATASLLGLRNAFYGLSMSPVLSVTGARRAVAAQLTIDESTAMAVGRSGPGETVRAERLAFWATGLSVFVLWNLATLAGSLGAGLIGDPRTYGLDAAIGAGLLALVWPRLVDRRSVGVAVVSAAVALALTPVLQPGVPVLLTSVVAVVAGVSAVRDRARRGAS
ncbi:MAG: AzlC family ABC transporter permease [Actinobacteria bacterium]|nr:AzlC family ABC transporter permease [Actinomycetota bacterium]